MKKEKVIIVSILLFILVLSLASVSPVYSKGVFTKLFNKSSDQATLVSNIEEQSINLESKKDFLEDMAEVYDFVKKQYYKEVDDTDIFEGALEGLMNNLGDPYSTFVTREKAKSYEENIQGSFGGLGIYINEGYDDESGVHYIKVVSPIEGTPAYYIGLRSGDLIVGVDEESTAQMSTRDAVKLMRGKPGTKVTLTIKRNKRIFDVTIIRDIINTVDLRSGFINDDIAYIRVLRFNKNTSEAFADAIKEFDARGYSTLIVDLRDNPGGSLQAVIETVNFFFEADTLLLGTESRIPSENKEYTASSLKIIPDNKKVVVMINGGSASASEIFSGAIKDNKRGTLVGEKTFGKGLVQSVTPYKGGYITMTISQYYTPAHNFIDTLGIAPDIVLTDDIAELDPEETIHAAEMVDAKLADAFLEERKGKLTNKSVAEFQKILEKNGWSINNKEFLRRYLYRTKDRYDNVIPTFSLEIDAVLSQTVGLLKSGKI